MRPLANLADRVGMIGASIKVAIPVRRVSANRWRHLQAVLRKVELANHLRSQQAHKVGGNRELVARDRRFGQGCAAKDGAAFKDERLQPRLREVGGGGESVMAAANDDCVVPFRH